MLALLLIPSPPRFWLRSAPPPAQCLSCLCPRCLEVSCPRARAFARYGRFFVFFVFFGKTKERQGELTCACCASGAFTLALAHTARCPSALLSRIRLLLPSPPSDTIPHCTSSRYARSPRYSLPLLRRCRRRPAAVTALIARRLRLARSDTTAPPAPHLPSTHPSPSRLPSLPQLAMPLRPCRDPPLRCGRGTFMLL